jgi:raffinose/stachyose/melibiose transport system permease protein
MRNPIRTATNQSTAMFVSLLIFVPIYLVGVNSLKTDFQARSMGPGLPTELRFDNYGTVIEEGKLGRAFINSVIYTGAATLLCLLLATSAAFVLSRRRTRLNRYIYLFLVIGIAMPLNYVTLTKVMQATHLINTEVGMIVVYSAFKLPFAVFVIYAFIHTVPEEIDEAAIIDGCSPRQLFWLIMVPLLRPAWITVGILTLLDLWSEFIMPLYFLSSSDKWPMTLAIYNFFGIYESSWNLVSADVVLTIVPVLIVFALGQRYIESGMTTGAVKG